MPKEPLSLHVPGLWSQSLLYVQLKLVCFISARADDLDGLLGELPEDFFSAPAQADCC